MPPPWWPWIDCTCICYYVRIECELDWFELGCYCGLHWLYITLRQYCKWIKLCCRLKFIATAWSDEYLHWTCIMYNRRIPCNILCNLLSNFIYNISTCYCGLLIDPHDLPVDCNVALHITIVPGTGDCSWILRISTYNCPLVLATATADWYLLPSIDIWHCRLVLAKINCLIW